MTLMTILATMALANFAGGIPAAPPARVFDWHGSAVGPSVEVWTSDDDVLRRGQQVRVFFRASQDAYVTVFRIDTDGRLRVIFPSEPWEDNFARGGQRYETRTYGDRYSFIVDDQPGQGYVFAVASADPFTYNALVRGDHWDYREISATGRITGDPYVALTDLVERIVPANYSEYSYDILPYYVEQRYEYPRFLCYDCHSYASYSYWNPYYRSCFKFRVVVYDDYYYNPVRYGGRARIVYTRTTRIAPRYVFKDRASPAEQFVTRVRQPPVDAEGRRVLIDQGVRGRDLGGVGQVPSPIERRQTGSDIRSGTTGGVSGSPERRSIGGAQTQTTTPEAGRRSTPDQTGRTVAPSDDSRRAPTREVERPTRATETTRQLPTLERRGEAQREPEQTVERNIQRPEPRSEPRREPDRQVERPEPQREPVVRQQPPSREPERRQPEARQPERAPARQPEARQPERQPEAASPKSERSPEKAEEGRRRPEPS